MAAQHTDSQHNLQHQQQHHCKDCGLFFDSVKSLDVHLHYHKENLLSKWASSRSGNSDQEANNNTKGKHSRGGGNSVQETVAAPADSSDSLSSQCRPSSTSYSHPVTPVSYSGAPSPYQDIQHRYSPATFAYTRTPPPGSNGSMYNSYSGQNYQNPDSFYNPNSPGYIIGTGSDFPITSSLRSSTPSTVTSTSMSTSNANFRFHPYHQQGSVYPGDRTISSSSPSESPRQCEKCGCVCESDSALAEHTCAIQQPPTPTSQGYMIDAQHHSRASFQPPSLKRPTQQVPTNNNGNNGYNFAQQMPSMGTEQTSNNLQLSVKTEPAEEPTTDILDLDSHKVHQVYQPDDSSNSANTHSGTSMQWGGHQEQKLYAAQSMGLPHEYLHGTDGLAFQSRMNYGPSGDVGGVMSPGTPMMQGMLGNQISSRVPLTQPAAPRTNDQSWKSNEARRPKTYNCSTCNKWFTSSGHLKRHYNTTLHKNAVKTSGVPDPAHSPITSHHHPSRDPPISRPMLQSDTSPTVPSPGSLEDSSRSDDASVFGRITPQAMLSQQGLLPPMYHGSPNGVAGPSSMEDSKGLQFNSNSNSVPTATPSPLMPIPHYMAQLSHPTITQSPMITQQMDTMYPNALPPHVMQATNSTNRHIQQTTFIGSDVGNNMVDSSLDDIQQSHPFVLIRSNVTTTQEQNIVAQNSLPSFSQLHQAPSGMFFNQSYQQVNGIHHNGYVVDSSLADVRGLNQIDSFDSLSDNRQHIPGSQPGFMSSPVEEYGVTNIDDINNVTSLDSEASYSPRHNNNNNNSLKSCSDLSLDGSSPIGTPDGISSTNSDIEKSTEEHTITSTNTDRNLMSQPVTTNTERHVCIECDKVFNRACYLTQHNKSFHSGHKPFKCHQCGKRFPDECQYKEHIAKHNGDKPHKCVQCPKQFNHKTDLRRHMCIHNGEKPHPCDICGKGFIRKDHMLKHSETHRKRNVVHQMMPPVLASV